MWTALFLTHSDDHAALLFASDRRFRLWRYGAGHSQMLLRSLPSAGQRCLDITFERVTWLSLPTSFDSVQIALAADGDVALPAGVAQLADEWSPFRLVISSQGVSGWVICARAEAAFTSWNPSNADADGSVEEILWSLSKS